MKFKLKLGKTGPSRSLGGDILVFSILLIVGLFMLLPFAYALIQSFKPTEEIFAYPPKFFVVNPTTENYETLTQLVDGFWIPLGRYILNTAFVTLVGTGANVVISSMAAFPAWPGRRRSPRCSCRQALFAFCLSWVILLYSVFSYDFKSVW